MDNKEITNTNPVPEKNATPTSGPIFETIPETNTPETPVVPPTNTIETLDELDQSATPVQPINPVDNFGQVPRPPIFPEEEKFQEKEKGNKTSLIILLVVALIAIIGGGLYYFLVLAKQKAPTASVVTKEVKLELGSTLSTNAEDYADISGYTNCQVDTSKIDVTKVSTYPFTITCGTATYDGTVVVDDTKAPEVVINELTVLPNAQVKPEDFIETCNDASKCSYKFKEEDELTNNLKTIGEYTIDILVSDEYNNEVTVSAKLIVSNEAPVKYVNCTAKPEDVDSIYATQKNSYRFGVDIAGNFYNAKKTVEFSFESLEDYENIKNEYQEEVGINNIIGTTTFNDNTKTITIKMNKTLEEINKEVNTNLPKDINTIKAFLGFYNYTCD